MLSLRIRSKASIIHYQIKIAFVINGFIVGSFEDFGSIEKGS